MITPESFAALGALGETVRLLGNHRMLLDEGTDLWLVGRGRVEVFAVEVADGEPVGARHHLVTLLPGDGVPALATRGPSDHSLLAVAAEESSLARVRRDALLARPDLADAAVDRILVAVLGAIADRDPRQIGTVVESGARIPARPGQRIGSRSTPVWALAPSGSNFEGVPFADRGPFRPIPLAGGAWMDPGSETELEVLDTAGLRERGLLDEGLESFTELIREYARAEISRKVAHEKEQLDARATEDARSRSEFLRELLAIVVPGAAEAGPATVQDTLLEACRAVGRVAGLRFRKPPAWEAARGTSDPLSAICGASRVRSRRVALRGEWWKSDVGPLLCYRGEAKAPVAILPGRGGTYEMLDPGAGARILVDDRVRNELEPFGYTFYRPLPDGRLSLWDLFRFGFTGLSWSFWSIAGLATMSGLLGLVLPIATGFVFRTVIPSAHPGQLFQLFIGLVVVTLAATAFELTRGFTVLRIQAKGGTSMQAALFDRLLKLPPRFFRQFTIGDLVARVGGVGQVQSLLSGTAVTAILGGLTGSLNLALLFTYDWRLAMVGVVWAAVAMIFVVVCGWLSVRVQGEVQDQGGRLQGFVLQLVTGIAKIRLAGAEDRALAQWGVRYASKVRLERRAAGIQAVVTVFNDLLPLITSLVLFSGVGVLVSQGFKLIDTGAFIAFNAALGTFMAAAIATGNTLLNMVQVVPLLNRARPILVEEPEVRMGKPDPGELTGRIEGRHLSFRYRQDGPLILDDVTFEAHPGEFVAFVGPSGSGKSTALRLLLGFEQPESGGVYYDGQDLASVDVSAVRRQMGVVLQSSRVMSGDILSNIIGAAPLTADDAWEAAELAGFADDIRSFPMALHTVVSEGGGTLSGGQRQRLLIARALATKPRIILFDEATSALDNRTQRTVSESLDRMHATRIVIAHRLSTIQNAHRIYVVVKGRVVETGTYAELMRTGGVFSRLAARQLT
ncbi:MAG: NHLP bacteriocin export ABC transporter permease/ATPase subunit [Longimicrobiales bacterium]